MQPDILARVQPESHEEGVSSFRKALREAIGERNFHHWFEARTRISLHGSAISIAVGSTFLLTWMQRRFSNDVTSTACSSHPGSSVQWVIDATLETVSNESAELEQGRNPDAGQSPARGRATQAQSATSTPTGKVKSIPGREGRRFSKLASFVQGPCNELAMTAARQVACFPGERFNPLYIHGGVGVGKTHLAEGIYCETRKQNPEMQVIFMTAESFGNQFTHALRNQSLPSFRAKFRSVDFLIVDDIGFLDGKPGMQEEFLHTFEQLSSHGKQVVLTADCHPRLMSKMSDELTTRFLCGLVSRIEVPDLPTRRQIVQAKMLPFAGQVADDALDFVARRFVHSVRELEGALNTLQTWYTMTNRKVSAQTARQALSELERDCIRVVRLPDIEAAVCRLFGIDAGDLKSDKRTRSVSQPRMLAMFLARRHTQAAYKEIGAFFGGRNHSTVVAAEKKVDTWMRTEKELTFGGRNWHLSDVMESLEQQLLAG
ncbi:MAG: chromosomal replication initiator protein DnaA [Planctomycetota bacterium]|nr:chromosomal replication initiator protein DnaA [Planctomycetota bacterium]